MRSALAALALLIPLATPALDTPVEAYQRRQAACDPVRSKVLDAHAADPVPCKADWECEQRAPWYLGCDAWARRDFRLPADLDEALGEACGPFSIVPDCVRKVGACVAGRCEGRQPSGKGCEAARLELWGQLAAPTPCQKDADCKARRFPREAHAVEDGCEADALSEVHGLLVSCLAGRCTPLAERKVQPVTGPQPGFTRPSLKEPGCIQRSIRLTSADPLPTGLVVKFAVTKDGKVSRISVATSRGPAPLIAIADALQRCAWNPGRDEDGQPANVWVALPLRFHEVP